MKNQQVALSIGQAVETLSVEARMRAIRQRLEAPTHAALYPRLASFQRLGGVEAWCETCGAYDVSGNHAGVGHRVTGGMR